jgi:hypothetical protein
MNQNTFRSLFSLFLFLFFLSGCEKDIKRPQQTVSHDFESGSIGNTVQIGEYQWELSIADDNDNADLPDAWRCWWYIRMDRISTVRSTELTIKNSGWPYYYLPVYSYNQVDWNHFSEDEVTQNDSGEIIINKQFSQSSVYIARFYPYTLTDLEKYIQTIHSSPFVKSETPGYSQKSKPLYLLRISDFSIPVTNKKRIFIHARTHPGEVPPSFVIEGLINYLLSSTAEASDILSRFEFYIFPMQNVDGVIAGNYRSTPASENLEVMWNYDSLNPINLTNSVPPEISTIHDYAKTLMTDGGPAISVALNLHASNSEPDIRPFFYPHFGSESMGYSQIEASLWNKQLSFIDKVMIHYGDEMIEPIPDDGGRSFASNTYPESWWWVNFKDQVMAMTFEMTYGRAGYAPKWVEPNDYRNLGAELALSVCDYCDASVTLAHRTQLQTKSARLTLLKYPNLYPPDDRNEMKK